MRQRDPLRLVPPVSVWHHAQRLLRKLTVSHQVTVLLSANSVSSIQQPSNGTSLTLCHDNDLQLLLHRGPRRLPKCSFLRHRGRSAGSAKCFLQERGIHTLHVKVAVCGMLSAPSSLESRFTSMEFCFATVAACAISSVGEEDTFQDPGMPVDVRTLACRARSPR